jgi:hypothetical protein
LIAITTAMINTALRLAISPLRMAAHNPDNDLTPLARSGEGRAEGPDALTQLNRWNPHQYIFE